jgi:hypothetical protein
MTFMPAGPMSAQLPGPGGFYATRNEAEIARTSEILMARDTDSSCQFHVFELDVPNAAHRLSDS